MCLLSVNIPYYKLHIGWLSWWSDKQLVNFKEMSRKEKNNILAMPDLEIQKYTWTLDFYFNYVHYNYASELWEFVTTNTCIPF